MSKEKKAFIPSRGKFALRKDELDGKTEAGVIFTPKEDVHWVTGTIAAVGEPELTATGNVIAFPHPVGTRVLVTKEDGYDSFGSIMIFKQKSLIAVLDKDTKIG